MDVECQQMRQLGLQGLCEQLGEGDMNLCLVQARVKHSSWLGKLQTGVSF